MTFRVLLAGIFHETHTLLPQPTRWEDFALRRGDALRQAAGDGSPLAGALEVAERHGWKLVPALDLRATPSGPVEDTVVERWWQEFSPVAETALREGIDGVFLVLHGAMSSVSIPDVEGELLGRLRRLPGAERVPIVAVVDLHGNVSPQMCQALDAMVAYRENPHTDACRAAYDAAEVLQRLMAAGRRGATLSARPGIVWPPTGTATADEPMRSLEQLARRQERDDSDLLAINVFGGFSYADTPHTGVCFTASTVGDPVLARQRLHELCELAWERRAAGHRRDSKLSEVWPQLPAVPPGPVILVEPSDNIGGGAPGDGTALAQEFVSRNLAQAGVILNDPQAVARLAGCPIGARLHLAMGGKENRWAGPPLELEVELLSLSDGRFELHDAQSHLASMCGQQIEMGPTAVVRHGGVTLLLTSRKTPPFDLGQWRSQGIEPSELRYIAVKAAVAHRRAYDPITWKSFTVETPGPCSSDLGCFPFRHLSRSIYPLEDLPRPTVWSE